MTVRLAQKNLEAHGYINMPVAVVGAGMMGSSIAYLAANSKHKTLLIESDHRRLTAAIEVIHKRLHMTELATSSNLQDLCSSPIVVEAVTEDFDIKSKLFQQIEKVVAPDCLLASNTSCLSIGGLAKSISKGNRLLGMHFFHPVDRMPLVEVIAHTEADQESKNKAIALAVSLGKVPILVKDGPGFLVNRILCPYLIESALIAEEGVPLDWIEEAAVSFGMPMGPLALMDEIGLDISFKVAKLLHDSFDGRLFLPALLHKMEAMSLTGKKGKKGFFTYNDAGVKMSFNMQLVDSAKLKTSSQKLPPDLVQMLQHRLIMPMIDEASRCLSEKVVRKAREVDLAMVLGTGFPSFRGGLLRYADTMGIGQCINSLENIYSNTNHHPRKVAELLIAMSNKGHKFYHH
jgi:3-hydroxyacyl-CoA dehydrogenase/enoyl-CoA hydratase/3-hydroxybutyryl-CoA epimerase